MCIPKVTSFPKPMQGLYAATALCLLFSVESALSEQSFNADYTLQGGFSSGSATLLSSTHQLVGSVGQPFQSGIYSSADHLVRFKMIPPEAFDMDSDDDGVPNITDTDDDNDSLSDIDEQLWGTNPLTPDTDDDGIDDGAEVAAGRQPNLNEGAVVSMINSILMMEP